MAQRIFAQVDSHRRKVGAFDGKALLVGNNGARRRDLRISSNHRNEMCLRDSIGRPLSNESIHRDAEAAHRISHGLVKTHRPKSQMCILHGVFIPDPACCFFPEARHAMA